MEEVSTNSEIKEVATQEAEIREDQKEVAQQEPVVEDKQEKNWRAARSRINELEKEVKKRDEFLEKVLSMQQPQQVLKTQVEEQDDPDDEFINYGKVKKVAKKHVEHVEKKVQELEFKLEQQKQADLINSLRRTYLDFDDVVNAETLAILEEKEPELANTIGEHKDPYKIGIQSYKFIKALGIVDQIPSKRRSKEVEKKIEQNSKTVQTPQAYDKRPMAQAFRLTEAEKTKLYEEMTQFGSMAGSVPEIM